MRLRCSFHWPKIYQCCPDSVQSVHWWLNEQVTILWFHSDVLSIIHHALFTEKFRKPILKNA